MDHTNLTGAVQMVSMGTKRNGGIMTVGPNCPQCRRPMRLLVIEEDPLGRRGHFECFGCAEIAVPENTDESVLPGGYSLIAERRESSR